MVTSRRIDAPTGRQRRRTRAGVLAVLAWATVAFNSQRAGMATILVFFVVGLVSLSGVPDRRINVKPGKR